MAYISERFVVLIEHNADQLARTWLRDVKEHPGTPTYHTFDERKLYERAFRVYSQLGKWISRDTTKEDIENYYVALGIRRREEGFGLSEVIQALIMTRRHAWLKVQSEGLLDTALDLHSAMELNNRVKGVSP